MRRLAFVAPYGYPALAALRGGATAGFDYVGGAEMQQARLATTLAARGHDVWLVSADFGQPEGVAVEGVRVARAYPPFAGVPGLRFFHPRWSGVTRALDRVAPDVAYQRAAGGLTGQVALWAQARGKKFVFACAHGFDALPRSPVLPNPRDRWLYRYGLHHADRVLAQSAGQAELLRRHHGIAAAVVRNLIALPAAPAAPSGPGDAVVWLSTIKPEKRPAWVLAAARELPQVRFVIAGGPPPPPGSAAHLTALRAEAAQLPNVELTGFVPPAAVPALLARAALFVHTSPAEGFPNTLLEAWAAGVPSVSAVDPEDAMASGATLLAPDLDAFVAAVRALHEDAPRRRAMGARARAYVAARHAPDSVAAAFEQALGLPAPSTATAPLAAAT